MPPRTDKSAYEAFYLPDRLLGALEGIMAHPLTLIEAPSGFGKTTSLREYLGRTLERGEREYWYTCFGEAPERSWKNICSLLERVDADTAKALRVLEFPATDMLSDAVMLLRYMQVRERVVLVIDNYQLMRSENPAAVVEALSLHGNPMLHIVIVTQHMESPAPAGGFGRTLYRIDDRAFFFSEQDIAKWFRMSGIRLTQSEVARAHETTEGWIAALRLQMLRYRETGSFENSGDIAQLIESAFWNRMTKRAQEFLMSLSLLERFTPRQAAAILGEKALPDDMAALLGENPFIRYYHDDGAYSMHSILQDFLRQRLGRGGSEEFRASALRRAGQACELEDDYLEAARHYYAIRDFDAMLSMPLLAVDLFGLSGERLDEFALEIMRECPVQTLRKYPLSVLLFAFEFFARSRYEEFGQMCGVLEDLLGDENSGLDEQARRKIAGELEFIMSFPEFNDIERMSARHKAAFELLDGKPSLVSLSDPWTFGSVSVAFMYWRETGGLGTAMQCMDECLPYYIKLTRGHGTGGDCALRAEALLMRGEIDEAESLAHKTLYVAGAREQDSIAFCADLILARIALLRGDAAGYQTALDSIKKRGAQGAERACAKMADLCRAYLHILLGSGSGIPDWLCDTSEIERQLYMVVIPFGHSLYIRSALISKKYGALRGLLEPAMELARAMNYVLPQVQNNISAAAALAMQGARSAARRHLDEALALALPDGVYLPFAETALPEDMLREALAATGDRAAADAVTRLARMQREGVAAVLGELQGERPELTVREREIALLARDGLTTKEIAGELFISGETVKMTLKKVFAKLGIRSRSELRHMDIC